jgi:hypothetical protein
MANKFESQREEDIWLNTIFAYLQGSQSISNAINAGDGVLAGLRERMPVERTPYGKKFPRYNVETVVEQTKANDMGVG